MGNTAALFTGSRNRSTQSLKYLALSYNLVMPWLLAAGTGLVLTRLGMDVNWLRLVFTLYVATALTLHSSLNCLKWRVYDEANRRLAGWEVLKQYRQRPMTA